MVSQLCLMCGSTLNCQTLCLGARPRYSLVVDEDVKKPSNQPSNQPSSTSVRFSAKPYLSIQYRFSQLASLPVWLIIIFLPHPSLLSKKNIWFSLVSSSLFLRFVFLPYRFLFSQGFCFSLSFSKQPFARDLDCPLSLISKPILS